MQRIGCLLPVVRALFHPRCDSAVLALFKPCSQSIHHRWGSVGLSSTLLVLLRRRVVSAWLGAVAALSGCPICHSSTFLMRSWRLKEKLQKFSNPIANRRHPAWRHIFTYRDIYCLIQSICNHRRWCCSLR